jgi:hypothetical protein
MLGVLDPGGRLCPSHYCLAEPQLQFNCMFQFWAVLFGTAKRQSPGHAIPIGVDR